MSNLPASQPCNATAGTRITPLGTAGQMVRSDLSRRYEDGPLPPLAEEIPAGVEEMAIEVTKDEWREFNGKLDKVLLGLEAASVKIADLQAFKEKAEGPLSYVRVVGGITALLLLGILTGICVGIHRLATIETTVSHQSREISALQQAVQEVARDQKKTADTSFRPSRYFVSSGRAHYDEISGTLKRVDAKSIVLDCSIDKVKIECAFPLAPDARVLVKGEVAKLDALKPGTLTHVLFNGERVELIDVGRDELRGAIPVREGAPAPKKEGKDDE